MVDPFKNALLTLDVLDLLQPDYLYFLQALQGERGSFRRVVSVLDKAYFTEGSSTESRDEVEVI